jgi:hypothetical protein
MAHHQANPTPTICRGVLLLPSDLSVLTSDFALMDISGRRVLGLHPGENDIRRLSPGVYFVHSEPSAAGRQPSAVQKVIVTR